MEKVQRNRVPWFFSFLLNPLVNRVKRRIDMRAERFLFLILCRTAGSLLFELIGLSLCFIGFCSFL
jgi:hypothetical protein